MKKIKIGLCFLDDEDNVVVKGLLKSNWTVDLREDLKESNNLLVRDEIARVLMDGVKLELNIEVIKEMLNELEEIG